jgi:mRNA-degrading endonuclease toxin of MazEF toxin-antitoxin module
MTPRAGEIYWALLEGPVRRPVIVVSREELNRGRYVVVVPLTSQRLEQRRALPNCVPLRAGQFGLTKDCAAQAEAVAQVHQDELDLEPGPIGILDPTTFRALLKAIGYVLGADVEPE